MFDLTRQEKIILIFLSLSFVSGLGISAYKKTQKKPQLDVRPYEMTALQDADVKLDLELYNKKMLKKFRVN